MGAFQALGRVFGRPEPALPVEAIREAVSLADANPSVRSRRQGGAGTLITHGLVEDLDHNTATTGDKWYGSPWRIGIARKMLRDPHVRQAYETRTVPIRAADWDFEPASDSPIDREAADFCRYVFFERLNWDETLRLALGHIADGFALLEATDDIDEIPASRFPLHSGRGRGVVLTGLHPIPAWTVCGFHATKGDPLKLAEIEQYLLGADSEDPGTRRISADRVVRITSDQEGADFSGLPLMRSAYGAWKVRQLLLVVDAIRHERQNGTPTISLPEDATDDDIDAAEAILEAMRANEKGYMVLPHGFEFAWNSTTISDGTEIKEAIKRCEQDIAHVFGAAFMLLGSSSANGSYALASTQEGQYRIQVELLAQSLAAVFNHGNDGWSVVERVVRLNYGADAGIPRLVARNTPTRDWGDIMPTLASLKAAGVITPDDRLERFVRKVMRLPEMEPETARRAAAPQPEPEVDPDPGSDAEPEPEQEPAE